MRRLLCAILLLGVTLASSGCFTRQVLKDGENFRQALLDIYTEQVMDNLIRASDSQPFVQLAYRNCLITDLQTRITNVSNEYDPTHTTTMSLITGGFLSSTRGFTDKLIFGGSIERNRTMQFKADPVTGKADIFDYYRAFAADKSLFRISCTEPCCGVHIKRKANGRWYWVPVDAAGVFQQLALKTTFLRGPDSIPPITWQTTIVDIAPNCDENGWPIRPLYDANKNPLVEPRLDDHGNLVPPPTGNRPNYEYVLTLGQSVPNSGGTITISTTDCSSSTFDIAREYLEEPFVANVWHQVREKSGVKEGEPTNKLYISSPTPINPKLVCGTTANVYANERPNMGYQSPEAVRLEEVVYQYRCHVKPFLNYPQAN